MWDELIDVRYTKPSGKVKKLYTQKEVVEIIEVKTGVKVSVRTVLNWKKGNGLNRGQGIGQERGGYFKRNQQETICCVKCCVKEPAGKLDMWLICG